MGLLAGAGLYLGDCLPGDASNPKGYFENRKVYQINRDLLGRMGRDWTCPPPSLDMTNVDVQRLAAVVAELQSGAAVWGFKDPRTLFTLPAWCEVIESVRLVGVHRHPHDIALSLVARDGFTLEEARSIAEAYGQRLSEAHRRLEFPIVSFDAAPQVFLNRTRQIAESLGLEGSKVGGGSLFDRTLIHHRTQHSDRGSTVDRLEGAAELPIASLPVVDSSTIRETWATLPSSLAISSPTHLGPQYELHRAELVDWALTSAPGSGLVLLEARKKGVAPVGSVDSISVDLADFLNRGLGGVGGRRRWSHIVAPGALDWIPPTQVEVFLDRLEASLEPGGVIALSGWLIDDDRLPSAFVFGRALITASRDRPPFLHHLDELTTRLLSTEIALVEVSRMPEGRSRALLSSDPNARSRAMNPSRSRSDVLILRARYEELDAEVNRLEKRMAEAEGMRDAAHARAETWEARAHDLEKRVAEAEGMRDAAHARAQTWEAHAHAGVRRAREVESRLAITERHLQETRLYRDRLARRKVVRLGLFIARPLGPLFRALRRIRAGKQDGTS